MKALLFSALTLLFVLHQDFWWWHDDTFLFGLPIGFTYHILYCLATFVLMLLLVRFAWPAGLDDDERGSLMVTLIIAIYLLLVLVIGSLSSRLLKSTGEDYFVASRSIGPFVLLMTLFGTHMTAFAILGASAEAYRNGIGVFGLMASAGAIVVPTVFYFIGVRLWSIGKRQGYLTQVQFFRERFESDTLGLILFIVLVGLMIPYLLIGVMGGGITLNNITQGQIPEWAGSLAVCVVIFIYITFGGMRGTAWVNTFQTVFFMIFGALTVVVVIRELGGLATAMETIRQAHPELLVRGDRIQPLKFFTYLLIPLSIGMFPHIFGHWLSARSARTFKYPIIFYPICIAIVWIPGVLLGVLGHIGFDGLPGPQASSVLIRMVAEYAPGVLGGLLAAGVFAAIMSSLDSQTLSLGTMFTQDMVRHYGFHDILGEEKQVFFGRLFVLLILSSTFLLAQFTPRSIFSLAIWSFSGYAALFPLVVAALFWRRVTRAAAMSAVLVVAALWIYFFIDGWQVPNYSVGGLIPVGALFLASTAVIIGVSLVTRPPAPSTISKFFGSS